MAADRWLGALADTPEPCVVLPALAEQQCGLQVTAYYNEHDPFAAAWLRGLISRRLIAPGDVDERDIQDVRPTDVRGYTQVHCFAGIGVWSHALRNAGWPDDRPVWTGSCPCQPFSAAGAKLGFADERHLWPHWHHLIWHEQPPTIFGEQVAKEDGRVWLSLVRLQLEASGYAVGAADLNAAGVGAPHIRQRHFFVADTDTDRRVAPPIRHLHYDKHHAQSRRLLGHADDERLEVLGQQQTWRERPAAERTGAPSTMVNAQSQQVGLSGCTREPRRPGDFWHDAEWIYCRDEKWRPIEPGTFPLVDGLAGRVGLLRGYGNAIVAPLAQTFIEAYLDI